LNHSLAFAFCTFLYIFTTFSIAFLTVSVPLNVDIFHSANVHIIECDLNFNKLRFGLSGSGISLASSTEKAAKDVSHSTTSRWTTVLNTFLTVFIIQLSLFGIGESLIGVGDFFEFIGVASFIRVFLQSFSSESFSDLLGSGLFVDTKEFIVLCGVDLFFLLG
jgi:hypothetical protein